MTTTSLITPADPINNPIIANSAEQINQSSSWLTKAVKWLRADDEQEPLFALVKNVLAVVLAILLTAFLFGIPVVWRSFEIWQELGELNNSNNDPYNIPANANSSSSNFAQPSNSSATPAFNSLATPASKIINWTPLTGPQVMTSHNKLCKDKSFSTPLLKFAPFDLINREDKPSKSDVWPTLEGIALLTDDLCAKKGVNNLYVCRSLAVFRHKLEEIDQSTEDVQMALIVPCYQDWVTCADMDETHCHKNEHKAHDHHAQHRVPVMIDKKKDGEMKICVMDSSQDGFLNMSQTDVKNRTPFGCSEQIHAHIRAANLKPQTTYYHTQFKRHHSRVGGCDIFALQDAISYLRMPNFFEEIEKKGECKADPSTYLSRFSGEKGTIDNPYYVTKLPPDFVRLAQSTRQIEDYKTQNARKGVLAYDLNQKLGKKEKEKTFQQKLNRTIIVKNNKSINLSIDYKIDMFRRQILSGLENKNPAELREKINRRLLVA